MQERGDTVRAVKFTGRRVTLSGQQFRCGRGASAAGGFSLIELVITITVMTILTLGVMPLVKLSVKRQKEQQLRDTLRQMRMAIDEFHRDTNGMSCQGIGPPPVPIVDPRSKVVMSDCTIFGVDNPDRFPPDLETLVNGVNVIPRVPTIPGGGSVGPDGSNLPSGQLSTKKKVYLRELPKDPITGEAEWEFRSCYDAPDAGSWGGENVFDVRSKSKGIALNGEKYSDW
jgi:general secretion pathway protein G